MNGKYLFCRAAEVNGIKQKSLRTGCINALQTEKEPSKETILTRLNKSFMDVFGDDFSAVDFREELCYRSLTEKANSRGAITIGQ